MKKQKGQLTKLWSKAKQIIDNFNPETTNIDELSQTLELGILQLSILNLEQGITDDKAIIEGVKKEVWHERFWVSIEKYVWPTYPDYEENWRVK